MGARWAVVAVLAGSCLWVPVAALADASVAVRLTDSAGRPIDGTVTLAAGATRRTCRTTAGRCTITAPAGSYTATVAPTRGGAPPSRSLRVPASGTVTLAVSTPASTSSGSGSTPPRVVGSGSGGGSTVTRVMGMTSGGGTSSGGTSGSTSGSGTTSGGTTSGTTATAGRSLSSGTRVVCQGTVQDTAGRPADGTVTVRRGGTVVGTARTTAGRFSLYDLPAGSYSVTVSGPRGSATSTLSVGAAVTRPTIRLR